MTGRDVVLSALCLGCVFGAVLLNWSGLDTLALAAAGLALVFGYMVGVGE